MFAIRTAVALLATLTIAGSAPAEKVSVMAKSKGGPFTVEVVIDPRKKGEALEFPPFYPPPPQKGFAPVPDEIPIGQVESGKHIFFTRLKTDGATFVRAGIPQQVTYSVMDGKKVVSATKATDEPTEVEVGPGQFLLVTVLKPKLSEDATFNVQYGVTSKGVSFALVLERPMFYEGLKDGRIEAEANNMTLLASKDWGTERTMGAVADKVASNLYEEGNKKIFTNTSELGFRVITGRDSYVKDFPDSIHTLKEEVFAKQLKLDLIKATGELIGKRRYPPITQPELQKWKNSKYVDDKFKPTLTGVTLAQGKEQAGKLLSAAAMAKDMK